MISTNHPVDLYNIGNRRLSSMLTFTAQDFLAEEMEQEPMNSEAISTKNAMLEKAYENETAFHGTSVISESTMKRPYVSDEEDMSYSMTREVNPLKRARSVSEETEIVDQNRAPESVQSFSKTRTRYGGARKPAFSYYNEEKEEKEERKKKTGRKKKPKGSPRRPLSAYNIFFKEERIRILASLPKQDATVKKGARVRKNRNPHHKISFATLGKTIGSRWKQIDKASRAHYEALAKKDSERYAREMKAFQKKQDSSTEDEMCKPPSLPKSCESIGTIGTMTENFSAAVPAESSNETFSWHTNVEAQPVASIPKNPGTTRLSNVEAQSVASIPQNPVTTRLSNLEPIPTNEALSNNSTILPNWLHGFNFDEFDVFSS